MTGLLINGARVQVPAVRVIGPGDEPWCALAPGDYRMRQTTWVRSIVVHATGGYAHQHIKTGAGPGGRAKAVAEFWRGDPVHSGAHVVVDADGSVACLADLATVCAYHATVSNDWSIGIEMVQMPDGGIYEATFDSTVKVLGVIADHFGISRQFACDAYTGHPIARLLDGGPHVVGAYGHRNNTEQRGWGDPGDEIWRRLALDGWTGVLLAKDQDISLGMRRQAALNARGAHLVVDGVLGPASIAEMRRQGFVTWGDVA